MIPRLLLATHNADKHREFTTLLAPYKIEVLSAKDLNLPEPEETGTTFTANALLKARAAAHATNLPALADDSGLCVTALNNRPGIHSARWGGPTRDFTMAMQRIITELVARVPVPALA